MVVGQCCSWLMCIHVTLARACLLHPIPYGRYERLLTQFERKQYRIGAAERFSRSLCEGAWFEGYGIGGN